MASMARAQVEVQEVVEAHTFMKQRQREDFVRQDSLQGSSSKSGLSFATAQDADTASEDEDEVQNYHAQQQEYNSNTNDNMRSTSSGCASRGGAQHLHHKHSDQVRYSRPSQTSRRLDAAPKAPSKQPALGLHGNSFTTNSPVSAPSHPRASHRCQQDQGGLHSASSSILNDFSDRVFALDDDNTAAAAEAFGKDLLAKSNVITSNTIVSGSSAASRVSERGQSRASWMSQDSQHKCQETRGGTSGRTRQAASFQSTASTAGAAFYCCGDNHDDTSRSFNGSEDDEYCHYSHHNNHAQGQQKRLLGSLPGRVSHNRDYHRHHQEKQESLQQNQQNQQQLLLSSESSSTTRRRRRNTPDLRFGWESPTSSTDSDSDIDDFLSDSGNADAKTSAAVDGFPGANRSGS
eukprot:CAMPEP_0171568888 /NCGR_PEP_ID=MMETSP0961-20121227/2032_1 /TAXON_ID=87120 /ORGANISM="Aurantiochytrium limacinum, Strain ATCCMYA-1381" /LENGTH=404 /DNA_ID=CAMNT_0012123103 /DNA_START=745 /DNA_END=1957 /DNA_ORIENTATION=-